jgi:hypothetical protein
MQAIFEHPSNPYYHGGYVDDNALMPVFAENSGHSASRKGIMMMPFATSTVDPTGREFTTLSG